MKVPVWLRWVSRLYILSAAAALLWQWFHYEGLFRAASEAWIEANGVYEPINIGILLSFVAILPLLIPLVYQRLRAKTPPEETSTQDLENVPFIFSAVLLLFALLAGGWAWTWAAGPEEAAVVGSVEEIPEHGYVQLRGFYREGEPARAFIASSVPTSYILFTSAQSASPVLVKVVSERLAAPLLAGRGPHPVKGLASAGVSAFVRARFETDLGVELPPDTWSISLGSSPRQRTELGGALAVSLGVLGLLLGLVGWLWRRRGLRTLKAPPTGGSFRVLLDELRWPQGCMGCGAQDAEAEVEMSVYRGLDLVLVDLRSYAELFAPVCRRCYKGWRVKRWFWVGLHLVALLGSIVIASLLIAAFEDRAKVVPLVILAGTPFWIGAFYYMRGPMYRALDRRHLNVCGGLEADGETVWLECSDERIRAGLIRANPHAEVAAGPD